MKRRYGASCAIRKKTSGSKRKSTKNRLLLEARAKATASRGELFSVGHL
jgi:hypothetical protein